MLATLHPSLYKLGCCNEHPYIRGVHPKVNTDGIQWSIAVHLVISGVDLTSTNQIFDRIERGEPISNQDCVHLFEKEFCQSVSEKLYWKNFGT